MNRQHQTPFTIRPNDPRFHTYMVATGWLCPRCQKVNNPTLDQCPCVDPEFDGSVQIDIVSEFPPPGGFWESTKDK